MNILHLYAGTRRPYGGCETYRSQIPLDALQKMGWRTAIAFLDEVLGMPGHGAGFLASFDVVVLPRLFVTSETLPVLDHLVQAIRIGGAKIVYETDDDLTNEFRQVHEGDTLIPMNWADAVTVTTEYLKRRLLKFTNKPIRVLPNSVDNSLWGLMDVPRFGGWKDKIVIGLTGSSSHGEDWHVIDKVIPAIIEQYPSAVFVIGGFLPDYLKGLLSEQVKYVPPLPYPQYVELVKQFDIVLCPLIPEDRFNKSKSPIKAIEALSAARMVGNRPGGALPICSAHTVYTDLAGAVITKHTASDWLATISRYLDNPEALRKRQREWFRRHPYQIHLQAPQWANFYQWVVAR